MEQLNRSDLIESLARGSGLPPESARRAIECLFGSSSQAGLIAQALKQGERVQVSGFGTFEARRRRERLGRNPRTHEQIVIPEGVTPAFRAGAGLREQVR